MDRFQKISISPYATAILGGTGTFAGEAHGVALASFPRQRLFDAQLVFPAIPEIVLIEERQLFAPHETIQGHGACILSLQLSKHLGLTIRDTAYDKLMQVRALPPHYALQDMVQLCQRRLTGDLHPAPDRRLTPFQGHLDLIHDTRRCPRGPSHLLSSC